MRKSSVLFLILLLISASYSFSQGQLEIVVSPNPLVIKAGETVKPEVKVLNSQNEVVQDLQLMYQPLSSPSVLRGSGLVPSSGAAVDTAGVVTGQVPGEYSLPIIAMGPAGYGYTFLELQVTNSDVSKITLMELPEKLYVGSSLKLAVAVQDANGFTVKNPDVSISIDNKKVGEIDDFHNLRLLAKGSATLTVSSGEVTSVANIKVEENPVNKIEISPFPTQVRTGDVIQVEATLFDDKNKMIKDIPVQYSVNGTQFKTGGGAGASILSDGRFVAEEPGIYNITVNSGNRVSSRTVEVIKRDIERPIKLVGKGTVSTKHTSDLWIWEGVDGKDYGVTGTWGADGMAYFWDVTDPANIQLIDSVQVDARTVNDVKVSSDGKTCIISREGASNRKNGIVIFDVSNPRDVKELSVYTENLTGGVHNLFIYEDHVYALSNGQKYEIISIKDPSNPVGVGKFEIDNPARAIHDVWIEDGIAYSSNWNDGVILVDIGNGVAGGSPSNPVEIGRYRSEGDANHAAFPYTSKSTGRKYVIAGDEIFPRDFLADPDAVFAPDGYLHFIDITDPDNPVEIARYEVPEAGSHNFWIEDDVLYVAYYNGGVRVVDISGDLVGDLYNQDREIAVFKPYDRNGYIPNAPFVWGAQPHKGHVFFSDYNSGLWSVKVEPVVPDETRIQTK